MMQELIYALPLTLIFILSIAVIMVDAFTGKNKTVAYYFSIAGLLGVIIAAIYTMTLPSADLAKMAYEGTISKGMLTYGGYAAFFDILFAVAGILTIVAAKPYLTREYGEYKEFYSLIIFAISGMMTIAHASNMVTIFIGIEIMSITFYVLAGFIRTRITSVEAALKYFLLGSFASGFLLYGMAMVYGATGTLQLQEISAKIATGEIVNIYLQIGLALLIIGLSFKVAAFPFHQWAPDVYTGSPTVVTGFMSTAGKAAALVAFIVIAKSLLPTNFGATLINDKLIVVKEFTENATMIIALISAATMLIGNITAIAQKNVKRMLAYSSVAHAGYLMMGIVANNENGFAGIVFYSTAYMLMQIGAFVVVGVLERDDTKFQQISDYSGLRKSHPYLAAVMALFMFSLAGIPPMAGFPGKYLLFTATIQSGYTWLTIVAVVSSIISMWFYIGLVLNMYFKEKEGDALVADVKSSHFTIAVSVIGVIILGILPSFLIDLAKNFF